MKIILQCKSLTSAWECLVISENVTFCSLHVFVKIPNLPYSQAYIHEKQSKQLDINSHSHWTFVGSGFKDEGGDAKEMSGQEEDFFDLIDADVEDQEEDEDHYVEDEDAADGGAAAGGGELESKVCLGLKVGDQTGLSPFRNSPNHSKDYPNLLPTNIPHEPSLHSIAAAGSNKENDAVHANENGDCLFVTSTSQPDVIDGDITGVRSSRLLSTGGTFPRVSLASRVGVIYIIIISFTILLSPLDVKKKTWFRNSRKFSPE